MLQPDFSILDAYYDIWQQLAHGCRVHMSSVERLMLMPQYRAPLARYEQVLGVSANDLATMLLSLGDGQADLTDPLAEFRAANRRAVDKLGYIFDILFPLRRLRLTRGAGQLREDGLTAPRYIRIMPDVLSSPYLVADALVVDFFALSLNERGHVVAGGLPVDRFVTWHLKELLK